MFEMGLSQVIQKRFNRDIENMVLVKYEIDHISTPPNLLALLPVPCSQTDDIQSHVWLPFLASYFEKGSCVALVDLERPCS